MPTPLASERRAAAAAVAEAGLLRTPLIAAPALSTEHGVEVRLKLECQQLTGSFKPRGAVAAVSRVPVTETVVTASAGNHGIGVAFACARLHRAAVVFVPGATDRAKVDALREFDERVRIELVDGDYDDTETVAREASRLPGRRFVSSYNDPLVVAGQSTVGTEILAQWPDCEAIIVGVGGGGLLAGVALAAADAEPPIAAWGVEPLASAAMSTSVAAGQITPVDGSIPTIAQALVGNLDRDSITFELVRDYATGLLTAGEDEIRLATARLYTDHALVVEPSGAIPLCGLRHVVASGATHVACVLSGSNIAAETHFELIAEHRPANAAAVVTRHR